MKFQIAHYSLTGTRASNQDRVAYAESDNGIMMVLADGLGGHEGGEIAAELLTQTLVHAFQSVKHSYITKPSAFLALAINQAHKRILASGQTHIPPITPRTTCVVCLVQRGYAYWAHVGDSRLYHFRDNDLLQRTRDHSTTEQLHQDGLLSEDEMRHHPEKGHLLKCVGGPRKPTISLGEETVLHRGDMLLLCSDGLWQAFNPSQLARYLRYDALDEGIEEMLLAAENKMKHDCDNLTAICLRWDEGVTKELPLQAAPAKETSIDALWSAAKVQNATRSKKKSKSPSGPKTHKEELEETLRELEEFVKQFEPPRQ